MTDSDSPIVQSQQERELNHQLEYDDDDYCDSTYMQTINSDRKSF